MKHMDRKSLGIEVLFANMSSVLSKANELNPQETVERLCEQPYDTRARISGMINGGLRRLTSDSSVDVKKYLNEKVLRLARDPVSPDSMERLLPFFEWLMELQSKNSLNMAQAVNSINDAAFHMDRVTGDFLKTYTGRSGQSIYVTAENDGSLILHTTEKKWGSADLIFPDVATKFSGTFPILGFLFWMDAEYVNGSFNFSLIIDVEFSDTDSRTRAVQDRNWVRLDFECGCPTMKLNACNYGGMIAMNGYRGRGFAEQWCEQLIMKASFVGELSLSEKEKKLLPFAQVLNMSYRLASASPDDDVSRDDMELMDKVLTSMDNRYQFERFEKLFEDVGQEQLYKKLEVAVETWTVGDFDETRKALTSFGEYIIGLEAEGKAGRIYQKLTELMNDCSSDFDGESTLYATWQPAHDSMRQLLEPEFKKLGFDGEYPHYRRRRGKKGEYISVIMNGMSEHPVGGSMKYRFAISAAVKKLTKGSKKGPYLSGGIPFEESAAEDHRYCEPKAARYTELGGDGDSMVNCLQVDVYNEANVSIESDCASNLVGVIRVAERAMRGKKTPRWYKKLRRSSKAKPKPYFGFLDAIVRYLPIGLYLTVLLVGGYLICDKYFLSLSEYFYESSANDVFFISTTFGVLLTLVCSLCKIHSLKKRIWRY